MNVLLRRAAAAIASFVVCIAAAGCGGSSDGSGSTGVGTTGHHALVSVVASLSTSPSAANAPAILHSAGADVDRVRAVISTTGGTILKDTTVTSSLAQLPLKLTLDVAIDPGTAVTANETLLAGGVAVFYGTAQLSTYSTDTPVSSIPAGTITAELIAPGTMATRVVLAAVDPSPIGAPVTLSAKAYLADNSEIANAVIGWTVDDTTIASVSAAGAVTPTMKAGTVHVTATAISGSSASVTVMFYAPAAKVVVVSGDGQSGLIGATMAAPFVVEVQSAAGAAVPNQTVAFGAANGSSVSPVTAKTGADGRAQTTVTLGPKVGTYGFSATSGSFSATMNATAVPDSLILSIVSGDAQTDTIQKTLKSPLVVRVVDRFGAPRAGVTVQWVRVTGAGTQSAPSTVTDASGLTSITYTFGQSAGVETVVANVDGVLGPVTFTLTALQRPMALTAVGSGQVGIAGNALATQVGVRVVDTKSAPVPNVQAIFAVASGGGSLSSLTATTDADGYARTAWTLGAALGTQTMTARIPNLPAALATVTAVAVDRAQPIANAWMNASGGNWSDPANWSLRRAPIAGDSVAITLGGAYSVALDVNPSVEGIILGDGNLSRPTLTISSRTLTVDRSFAIKGGAAVVLSGAPSVFGGAGVVTNAGTITLNADLTTTALTNNGTINVPAGRTLTTTAQFTQTGSLFGAGALVTNNASVQLGGATTLPTLTFTNSQVTGFTQYGDTPPVTVMLDGSSLMGNAGTGTLRIASGSHVTMKNSTLAGTTFILGGRFDAIGTNTVGMIQSTSTADIVVTNDGAAPGLLIVPGFDNPGHLTLQGSSNVDVAVQARINNTGTITAYGDGGSTRRIIGDLSGGTITVGPDGAGKLLVTGYFGLGTLNLHVGPGQSSSMLSVGGSATLQGTVNVTTQGGTPASNSTYNLLTYGLLGTTTFLTVNLPDGLSSWTTNAGATAYSITRK
ncbi:MAG TPA: hypothetical protein VGM82_09680 [Gemmatimonadaceae bacterium]|jgi:hypothetical protein